MKLRVLISILFIIATTFTALHELEHISGEHDATSCQICIVDDHSVSANFTNTYAQFTRYTFENILSSNQHIDSFTKKTTNHSNAPPTIS